MSGRSPLKCRRVFWCPRSKQLLLIALIPAGLPGILLASAATGVISAGISSAKGDKGAGLPEPNLSDFISRGGVVAADRLQFVIWTIVGIGTFLSIVISSDLRSISDLPRIPPGFLQLMGISSAGYLAGRLTRKAGPTMDNICLAGTPALMTFQLSGSGLSRSALFTITRFPSFRTRSSTRVASPLFRRSSKQTQP
jgi:hypothetical protein